MANVKQGNLTPPRQWWKHMDFFKRVFWKSERRAHKNAICDALVVESQPKNCIHDYRDPLGCYKVRCQLGKQCVQLTEWADSC